MESTSSSPSSWVIVIVIIVVIIVSRIDSSSSTAIFAIASVVEFQEFVSELIHVGSARGLDTWLWIAQAERGIVFLQPVDPYAFVVQFSSPTAVWSQKEKSITDDLDDLPGT